MDLQTVGEHEAEVSEGHPLTETPNLDFVTLGMFIIDEIEYPPPKPALHNILGGAGSFSALGARLFSPAPSSSTSVGWIVDCGSDFPPSMARTISSWQTSALFRTDVSRLTTRGWNGYTASTPDTRAFKYTTPKKRLEAADLPPALLTARAFHIIASPSRCQALVADLASRRRKAMGPAYSRPVIVWEPVPDRCTPDELLSVTNTLPVVDVCSPNHAELAALLGDPARGLDPATGAVSAAAVERGCEQLLASMPLQSFSLVVRAGERGCFVARNGGRKRGPPAARGNKGKVVRKKDHVHGGLQHDTDMLSLFAGLLQDSEGVVAREELEVDPGVERWFPAVYGGEGTPGKGVEDSTGAGNTFLGGLGVALARGKSIEEAAVWGSVAASFALEQVGVPVLGSDGQGNEAWNGVRVEDRLRDFQTRTCSP